MFTSHVLSSDLTSSIVAGQSDFLGLDAESNGFDFGKWEADLVIGGGARSAGSFSLSLLASLSALSNLCSDLTGLGSASSAVIL